MTMSIQKVVFTVKNIHLLSIYDIGPNYLSNSTLFNKQINECLTVLAVSFDADSDSPVDQAYLPDYRPSYLGMATNAAVS